MWIQHCEGCAGHFASRNATSAATRQRGGGDAPASTSAVTFAGSAVRALARAARAAGLLQARALRAGRGLRRWPGGDRCPGPRSSSRNIRAAARRLRSRAAPAVEPGDARTRPRARSRSHPPRRHAARPHGSTTIRPVRATASAFLLWRQPQVPRAVNQVDLSFHRNSPRVGEVGGARRCPSASRYL